MTIAFERALLDAASAPYRAAGRFAWHFSRSKLKRDPVFVGLLQRGIIPDAERLVDLGCGQGLLASWLRSARALFDAGHWRADWPAPPRIDRIFGVDLMLRDVERARIALGGQDEFAQGDIRTAEIGQADVIVLLDVLHFIDYPGQLAVLRRVHAALRPGGLLVARIGDAQARLPILLTRWVDGVVAAARGHRRARSHCRGAAEWTTMLGELGFRVERLPMSGRTPFANVMLIARVEAPAGPASGTRPVC